MPQPLQGVSGDAVARGRSVVVAGLDAVDQCLVIVAGEEEAACSILEMGQQGIAERFAEGQQAGIEFRLQQFQHGLEQIGVIVEIGVQVGVAVLAGRQQAAALPQFLPDEIQRAACRGEPVVAPEDAAGVGHALDHEGVPACQDLVVASRADALPACCE